MYVCDNRGQQVSSYLGRIDSEFKTIKTRAKGESLPPFKDEEHLFPTESLAQAMATSSM